MAQDHQVTGVWTCDDEECDHEYVAQGFQGMTPTYPQGWLVIQDGPWSYHCCGWKCVARHAVQKGKEREDRLAKRAIQKAELATDMPIKGVDDVTS